MPELYLKSALFVKNDTIGLVRSLILYIIFSAFFFPITVQAVVLNELMVTPSSGYDWVELYNPSSETVDLTGWSLTDNATTSMKTLSGSILGNGFLTFDVGTRLNVGGDTVNLKDVSSIIVDTHSYSSNPGTDISIGRSPDGETWATLTSTSKGSTNGGALATPTSLPPTLEPTSTPKPTTTPKPTPTTKPTSTPKPIKEPTATPTPKTTAKSQTTSTSSQNTSSSKTANSAKIPSNLLGESTSSAENNSPSDETPTQISPTQSINIPYIIGGVAFLLIGVGLLYIRFRTNEKISD
ncbi:hypothetical protein A3H85_01640 [Candidatus Daviesbacteria bacterium RIFCSPLOWO2_02_FULL_40_8]|nr:MAG: hypothetical protein A2780_00995 [Candidatus Daviesbacteria bacterium RIFCSPHIGHO2_01_FULL_41_45]OGE66810.1 MAG: hypothetical protein A3H85_01640 [Candidatus Daviesbacteria bacterium RIFCSPLOWO2_02_FULL_40_8]